MKRFFCPTAIVTGAAEAELARLTPQRLLMVADPYFRENGETQRLLQGSGAVLTALFSEIRPDPELSLVARGIALMKEFSPDVVVALGGGSAIDCAKAMVYFSGLQVTFVAIPTTSGSGSEVTDFTVLTHDGVKYPLVDDGVRPDVAVLDPAFLQRLPAALVAETGFDLISHALEAFVSTNAWVVTDALAQAAFLEAMAHLEASFGGDVGVRLPLHQAACMAGMAFSGAGLGLCHAMSHGLGGLFHISHGKLNACLLPIVLEHNAAAAGQKLARLARGAGLSGATDTLGVRNLKNALIRLRRKLQLPATLQEAGADLGLLEQKKDALIQTVLEDPCCKTNPVPVTADFVAQVLVEVAGFGG